MKDLERRASRATKKRRRKRIILIIEVVVLLILGTALYSTLKLNKIERVKYDDADIEINEEIKDNEILKGYRNIAVFGVDTRDGDLEANTRSDMIMIASINNDSKEVKLVSVYRDTYLDTGSGSFRKATEGYNDGGPQNSINMLNKNLDLDIREFVTVDFNAVAEVVDQIGGIDIEITEEEMVHLNNYSIETSQVTGKDYEPLTNYGEVHLNGVQAVSYSRIRYTAGDDYKRTERQRLVIAKIVEKVKQSSLSTLNNIINVVFPKVSTSFNNLEILDLAKDIFSYDLGENDGFPFEKQSMTIGSKGDCVIPITLERNVVQLHQFLFENEEYEPSEQVRSLSNQIINDSGLQ